ncbi:uncharacterized oxidoreductase [Noviherbaspirillum humi]|uniref:Uncharacterized oxidoreductase n=1 Tax=Noviherbaspirillum humi TaxID=1688639 RepID=A0A239HPZ0_9BURK|nr:SDR family NAD(P)-dependent oxidoreductase [Noviherbaspirillum humi]SNS83376.1 uncharacterized oxidoreductase [Noviherbaspirillum humi]
MQMSGNTILVTGGSSGIGLALAVRFLASGNEVIVCGRREAALKAVCDRHPGLRYVVSDTGKAAEREALARRVTAEHPQLNVLINNAGIQRKVSLLQPESWTDTGAEIDVNLGGPIHLSMLLAPHLRRQSQAHIVNVSSGLAFAPLAPMPVYCATKAALHSFTQSLRWQLRETSVRVTEVIPPAVKTNLGGAHDFGVELDEFAEAIMRQLEAGAEEASFGSADARRKASRAELDEAFLQMNEAIRRARSGS